MSNELYHYGVLGMKLAKQNKAAIEEVRKTVERYKD